MTMYNNENESVPDGESREGANARVSRKGTGFMTHTDSPTCDSATTPYVPEQKRNLKKPLLYLIGFGGLAAGTAMWLSPHNQVVEAERTRYASREACMQDWYTPEDCKFVKGDDTATVAEAASDAMASDASGASHAGGAHGSGGGWGGGHASRVSADLDATGKTAGGATDGSTNGPLDTDHGVATTNGGETHSTAPTAIATSGWYGPYYTRDGVVYHESGLHTTGVPVQHGIVSALAVRESALSAGSTAFHSTPLTVSVSEGRAISRGGFLSSRGGSGGHGGGEGGGGGHGSGGG
ncbi:MAG: hypothetical protein PCALPYG88_5336 [uncultured Paraburkholderia sp.]|nr:MAG: hypothetical protein PCALPYG08_5456 [uncultured Paraburkholderia sp.]CAH2934704.1 MAG: hypothetical protein PCALPYG88_5336 [uncultured Paraburkholderia sp.]